jgi:hypothetical protein
VWLQRRPREFGEAANEATVLLLLFGRAVLLLWFGPSACQRQQTGASVLPA